MNTKIIFTSALASLLFLSGCGNSEEISQNTVPEISGKSVETPSTQTQNPEISGKNTPEKKTKLVSKIVDRGFDIAKAVGEIQKTKDITTCNKLKSKDDISECQDVFYSLHLGGEASNEDCLKISDENRKNNCTQQFFTHKAFTEKNPEICQNIPDQEKATFCSNQFYREKAVEEKSLEVCKKIQGESEQEMCTTDIQNMLDREAQEKKRAEEMKRQAEEEAERLKQEAEKNPTAETPEISENTLPVENIATPEKPEISIPENISEE